MNKKPSIYNVAWVNPYLSILHLSNVNSTELHETRINIFLTAEMVSGNGVRRVRSLMEEMLRENPALESKNEGWTTYL